MNYYAVFYWGRGSTERDRKQIERVVKRASSVLASPIEEVGERRISAKLVSIMDNTSHPLGQLLQWKTVKATV